MSFDPVMPPYNASDPSARFLSASCLDFLLIELVPMAYRVTNELGAAAREQEGKALLLQEGTNGSSTNGAAATDGTGATGGGGAGAKTGTETAVMDEQEEREAVFWRLERIGYRVGQGLVERYVPLLHP